MAIQFSIAKRGLLPHEKEQQEVNGQTNLKDLRPQLECRETVDVVEFQSSNMRLPSIMPKGELLAAMSTVQHVLLHELAKGNAVSLPGIGTFRLNLKGDIEVKNGNFHGKDVRVGGLNFRPDRELMKEISAFEVDQVPFGNEFQADSSSLAERILGLFSQQNTITHKDVSVALGQTLTRSRITSLLEHLVEEGRLIREGKGAQTRYRLKN